MERSPDQAVLAAFARSVFAKSQLLNSSGLRTSRERLHVREAIGFDVRKYSDFLVPTASDAALILAAELGVELRTLAWRDQPRVDPGRKRFLLEHVLPVAEVRERCREAATEDDVAECLKQVRVAWILREEDDRLTELGYRTDRPDPAVAYQDAGISLAGLTYDSDKRDPFPPI